MIIPLTVIPLFLPNFTTSTPDGTLTPFQAVAFSIFTVALYGAFLALQTGRHSMFFREPDEDGKPVVAVDADGEPVSPSSVREVLPHVGLLLANILPIVIPVSYTHLDVYKRQHYLFRQLKILETPNSVNHLRHRL